MHSRIRIPWADVLATEGRKANLAKVRFVREILAFNGLKLALDDVRSIDEERHGHFDVALFLGILYHLNALDVIATWRGSQSFAGE